MALWAAERANVRVPKETWKRLEDWYSRSQNGDGGWGYGGQGGTSGSMSAVGVLGLIVSRHFGGKGWKGDPAVDQGLAWLRKNFKPGGNPGGDAKWLYYYMFALVRVGEVIGDGTWYQECVRWLLENQRPNGSWGYDESPLFDSVNTCFAILIFRRAVFRLDEPTGVAYPRVPVETPLHRRPNVPSAGNKK